MQVGFFGALTLLFVAAKLFGFITWSWVAVFSPVLFGLTISVIILILMAVAAFFAAR